MAWLRRGEPKRRPPCAAVAEHVRHKSDCAAPLPVGGPFGFTVYGESVYLTFLGLVSDPRGQGH